MLTSGTVGCSAVAESLVDSEESVLLLGALNNLFNSIIYSEVNKY